VSGSGRFHQQKKLPVTPCSGYALWLCGPPATFGCRAPLDQKIFPSRYQPSSAARRLCPAGGLHCLVVAPAAETLSRIL